MARGATLAGVLRVLLDGNVYNRLDVEPEIRAAVETLIEKGILQVFASPVVVKELQASPFGGIPNWFPVSVQPEGIGIAGLERAGMARSSVGRIFHAHRGESRKGYDAIIAESARTMRAMLVSDDRRCRERLKEIAGEDTAMSYNEFKVWVTRSYQ
jgi:predicted nucleic acid-binding protein